MAKFISVVAQGGENVVINAAHIVLIKQNGSGSIIFISNGDTYYVNEGMVKLFEALKS